MNERVIPVEAVHNVDTFKVFISDEPISAEYQLLHLTVTKEVNAIPTARIVLRDGDPAAETFHISEQEEYLPGKSIRITGGRDSNNDQLFSGVIVKHAIKAREGGESELVLHCRDQAVRMTLGRHNRYFQELTDTDIMAEMIGMYPDLTPELEDTGTVHREMIQHHCTDWDFLVMRAEASAKLVMVDDGTIKVEAPDTSSEPTLSVLYGATLLDFEAEMEGRNLWSSVTAKAWDFSEQQLFEESLENLPLTEPGNVDAKELAEALNPESFELRHSGRTDSEELEQWTTAILQASRLSKIRGRAKFIGFGSLKPGQMLELNGLGARFNGKAFVSGVRHDFQNNVWSTQAELGLNPERFAKKYKDIMDLPAGGLLPAINGLQIGKVVQLENDPEGEDRILVKLPVVDSEAQGIWARMVTLDAGQGETNNGRGSFFRPEIDDEVIVGFINDDPRDAVVLGMLNSSSFPAPHGAQDSNHEKGLVTRSKMRVWFNDDSKTITIDTPAGNSIELDEAGTSITIKDQNDNNVKLNADGIEMTSPGSIKIDATGSLDLIAGTKISLEAAQIAIAAQSTLELTGAQATIEGSGITQVKGSVVQIN